MEQLGSSPLFKADPFMDLSWRRLFLEPCSEGTCSLVVELFVLPMGAFFGWAEEFCRSFALLF